MRLQFVVGNENGSNGIPYAFMVHCAPEESLLELVEQTFTCLEREWSFAISNCFQSFLQFERGVVYLSKENYEFPKMLPAGANAKQIETVLQAAQQFVNAFVPMSQRLRQAEQRAKDAEARLSEYEAAAAGKKRKTTSDSDYGS